MNFIFPLIQNFLVERLARKNVASNLGLSGVLLMFFGFLLFFSGLFFTYAVYLSFVARGFEASVAAAITGLLVLLLAILSAVCIYFSYQKKRKQIQKTEVEIVEGIVAACKVITTELNQQIGDHPKMSLLTALLAGYLSGNKIK